MLFQNNALDAYKCLYGMTILRACFYVPISRKIVLTNFNMIVKNLQIIIFQSENLYGKQIFYFIL